MTTTRIKTAFVSSVLRQTAEQIQASQQRVVDEWNLFSSSEKKLYNSLKGHFSLANNEGGAKLQMGFLKYARFLDMADPRRKLKREGYHLYNRIMFGNIYGYSIPTIQWGFTDEIKAEIGQQLLEIEQSKYPHGKKVGMQLELVSTQVDRNLAAVMAKSLRMGHR